MKQAILAILIVALIGLSVYYYTTVYIPAQEQAEQIRNVLDEQ